MLFFVGDVPPMSIQLPESLQMIPVWERSEHIGRIQLWSDLVATGSAGNVWEIQNQKIICLNTHEEFGDM